MQNEGQQAYQQKQMFEEREKEKEAEIESMMHSIQDLEAKALLAL